MNQRPFTLKLNDFTGKYYAPLTYLGDPNKKIVSVVTKSGTKVYMRRGTLDKSMFWETWRWNFYKDPNLEIKKGDTIVDIGAQIGIFSLYAAEKIGRKGKIFAYEPMPDNFQILLKNIEKNHLSNVYVFNKGVWKKAGKKRLYVYGLNTGGHSIYNAVSDKFIEMSTVTLSDIVKKVGKINTLKIDVEGAEYDILLDTPKDVFKNIDNIVLEYHDYLADNHNYHQIINFLNKIGFKTKITGNGNALMRSILKQGIVIAFKK